MGRLHLVDLDGVPDRFDIHRRRHAAGRRPSKPLPRPFDADMVIARLEEAGSTLLRLTGSGSIRHSALAEAAAGYAETWRCLPQPPAARIARMHQALAWIGLIPADTLVLRRIVGCRCLVSPATERHLFSWQRLARLLGADAATVRRWHAAGINALVVALNRDAALARSWDALR